MSAAAWVWTIVGSALGVVVVSVGLRLLRGSLGWWRLRRYDFLYSRAYSDDVDRDRRLI
jgi:hypothetical protein